MAMRSSGLPAQRGPDSVGTRLRALRERQDLSGAELAQRVGISQSKISRLERGLTGAAPTDVRRIAEGLGLPSGEIEELVALAGPARRSTPPRMAEWRPDTAGMARKQAEIGRAEATSEIIRIFQPTIVAGLLQTSGYAEAVMRTPHHLAGLAGADDSELALAEAVTARIRRQQILKRPDKQFDFVMTESVFANRLVGPGDMLAQIHRIREINGQANVSVRVIRAEAALAEPPLLGFVLMDDSWLMIDLYSSFLTSQAPADIEAYEEVFDAMRAASEDDLEPILTKYTRVYRDLLA